MTKPLSDRNRIELLQGIRPTEVPHELASKVV
jgi:hypothetical protein